MRIPRHLSPEPYPVNVAWGPRTHTLHVPNAGHLQTNLENSNAKVSALGVRISDGFLIRPVTSCATSDKSLSLSELSFLISNVGTLREQSYRYSLTQPLAHWRHSKRKKKKKKLKLLLFCPGKGFLQNWPEASLLLKVNTFLSLFPLHTFQRGALEGSWLLFWKHFEDEKVSNPPETWMVDLKTNVYFHLMSYNLLKALGKWKYYLCSHKGPNSLE